MSKWFFAALAAGAALMSAAPALAQGASAAADAAPALQALVGSKFEGDLVITSIAVEGDTLVITIDAHSGWGDFQRSDAIGPFLESFCKSEGGAAYFKRQGAMRVDTLEKGGDRQAGPRVTSCPAAQPASQ